jgi:phosphinothricin acetyltransferase
MPTDSDRDAVEPATLTVPETPEMTVRLAVGADAEGIRAIYNREVEGSTVTFDMVARSLDEQLAWISEHSGSYPAIVAVDGSGAVLGFASLSPYRPRPAYATTVENSVYVHHEARGRGIAVRLMSEVVELAASHGFHAIIARIVGDHEASIALHARVGFEVIGREREVGRKFGRWLDVVLMQKML